MPGQGGDVGDPLPKRGQSEFEDVQPVEKVGPEPSRLHRLLEVPVRRRDDADVHADVRLPSHTPDLPVLQGPEELRLGFGADLGDLVEEEGPPLRRLEQADLPAHRAREGAALVAEQLALEEAVGEGGAVDGKERRAAAAAHRVDVPGDHLLPGPALPGQQDDGVASCDARQDPLDFPDGAMVPDDGGGPRKETLREDTMRLPQPQVLDRPFDDDQEARPVDRFLEVVVRPPLDRLDGRLDRPVRAVQDDRGPRRPAPDRVDQLFPAHPGHHEIGQHEVDLLPFQDVQGLRAAPGEVGLIPLGFQDRSEDLPLVPLVVDDEDGPLHLTRRPPEGARGCASPSPVPNLPRFLPRGPPRSCG